MQDADSEELDKEEFGIVSAVQIAAEVKNFDPLEVVDGKEVKKIDRFIQLGIKAAREAMQDAGFRKN